MPAFFKFSKNGRKDTPQNKNRRYAESNNSTMNRICKAFDDIGNINMNYAKIPQFNWQMLLKGPCTDSRPDISDLFCEMDNANVTAVIESQDSTYLNEKQLVNGYTLVAEDIAERMIEKFGSLEFVYPYIVKYLFADEGKTKPAHKQMFWRVFGNMAVEYLKTNIQNCDTCPDCNTKIPSWVKNHQCIMNNKGFYACIDCGKLCERTNSKQSRCEDCQEIFKRDRKRELQRHKRKLKKAIEQARITPLQSSSTET